MFRVENLSKMYISKKKRHVVDALKDISFDLPNKGLVFILGESGSGKTTLLNILSGIDTADSGNIWVANKLLNQLSIKKLDDYRNGMIDFIFQEFNLIEEINVLDNIKLACQLQNKIPDERKIDELLLELGLNENFKYRKINELSGGQKQRIGIIRALLKDSNIILADEPTGNLDSKTSKKVFDKLKEKSKNKLVIIITHDESQAYNYANQIVKINNGCIEQNLVRKTDAEIKKTDKENNPINNFIPVDQIDHNIHQQKEYIYPSNFVSIPSSLNFKLSFKLAFSALKCKKILLIIFLLLISILTFINLFLPIIAVYSEGKFFVLFNYLKNINIFINDDKGNFNSIFDMHFIFQLLYFFIFFITPALLIWIYFALSIRFKKREIGILKTLGSSNLTIIKIFLLECFIFSFLITLVSFYICFKMIPGAAFPHQNNLININFLTYKGIIKPLVRDKTELSKMLLSFLTYPVFERIFFVFIYLFFIYFLFSFISILTPLSFLYRKKTIDIISPK
nr:ATP-binding cassette domain-containing protein [Candidatus Phytoplasma sacchari]KAB8122720.1 ATP-binding cassette domain-containing protein [Candidatus Phytoplasma sacchari]